MFENRPIVTYSLRKDKHTACTNGWVKKDPITCKDMCLVLRSTHEQTYEMTLGLEMKCTCIELLWWVVKD